MVASQSGAGALARSARHVGLALALLSCAYLAVVAWQALNGPERQPIVFPAPGRWIGAWLACTLAMAVLAIGWHLALRAAGGRSLPLDAACAYASSQPAKYLPGNVVHFASRHLIGRSHGHQHAVLLSAMLLEAASLIGVALLLATIWQAPLPSLPPGWATWLPWTAALGLTACAIATLWMLGRRAAAWRQSLRFLSLHALCALGYFLATSAAFWLLAGASLPTVSAGELLAAVALSWVGGFVVIGAPGGIGVREALLLGMLAGGDGPAGLLVAIGAFRLTLIATDFTLFGIAWAWQRRLPQA